MLPQCREVRLYPVNAIGIMLLRILSENTVLEFQVHRRQARKRSGNGTRRFESEGHRNRDNIAFTLQRVSFAFFLV